MKLHGYYRSSASYRVRIALNLKKLTYESVAIHLTRAGGEQYAPSYTAMNPQSLVPVLEIGKLRIAQSLAIIEYLDEQYPSPALLPSDTSQRAYVRQLAGIIACDVHPLNNLRVLQYLSKPLEVTDEDKLSWVTHWISSGFQAMESLITSSDCSGQYCCGDTPGLAECCLIPQLFNARRFNVDLDRYPRLLQIEARTQQLPAFLAALPANQPDAE